VFLSDTLYPSETRLKHEISAVGIGIGYGLNGLGFEFRQGQEIFVFSKTSRPSLGPTQPPIQWVPGFFLRGKAAWA
jgi:hypothetical protein